MSTPMPSAPLRRTEPADPPGSAHTGKTDASACDTAALDSGALLQGHKMVAIRHNGAIYRLQATRLGKLILTK